MRSAISFGAKTKECPLRHLSENTDRVAEQSILTDREQRAERYPLGGVSSKEGRRIEGTTDAISVVIVVVVVFVINEVRLQKCQLQLESW